MEENTPLSQITLLVMAMEKTKAIEIELSDNFLEVYKGMQKIEDLFQSLTEATIKFVDGLTCQRRLIQQLAEIEKECAAWVNTLGNNSK